MSKGNENKTDQKISGWLLQNRWELLSFSAVYFFLAFINLRAKLFLTPAWHGGQLLQNHQKLLNFTYTNNEQSRLLQFYFPEFVHRVFGIDVMHSYILQRWLFVFLAFVVFHFFLRRWFDRGASLAGVALLAAIMPLSYFNHLQESAPLLMLSFASILWAIRDGKDLIFSLLLLLGAANNETVLFLPAVYFLFRYSSFNFKKLSVLSARTLALALPAFALTGMIRWMTRGNGHLGKAFTLQDNLAGLYAGFFLSPLDYFRNFYWYLFFIYGILWIYAFVAWRQKPIFLRRAVLAVPLFIVPHAITGVLFEVRQMIPIGFIVIPAALFYLLKPQALDHDAEGSENAPKS